MYAGPCRQKVKPANASIVSLITALAIISKNRDRLCLTCTLDSLLGIHLASFFVPYFASATDTLSCAMAATIPTTPPYLNRTTFAPWALQQIAHLG